MFRFTGLIAIFAIFAGAISYASTTLNVSGKEAAAIVASLDRVGLKGFRSPVAFYHVRSLQVYYTPNGFIFSHASMFDVNDDNRQKNVFGDDAVAILDALKLAGVKPSHDLGPNEEHINIADLNCTVQQSNTLYTCSIVIEPSTIICIGNGQDSSWVISVDLINMQASLKQDQLQPQFGYLKCENLPVPNSDQPLSLRCKSADVVDDGYLVLLKKEAPQQPVTGELEKITKAGVNHISQLYCRLK